ncbi:MAG: NAD(P)/FAD-dependent oxidoreductase [Alphaproteobacteria bacterium]|nr:NAD(P)/FAD-dependent oxidoreductase [Alphaproteobacteria bacterium]
MSYDADPSRANAQPTLAILGAGFSGLGMAIRLRQAGIGNFTIYEKADDVGGTWRENIYPGIACDVPSHLYSFSFEPNPNWSRRFSPGGEIWRYTQHCAKKYDLYGSIEFGKKITGIVHDGAKWCVKFADGGSIRADYVISCLGGLHEPNIPEIEGRASFQGPMFHTAKWREDVDLTDKRVAIIGSAASALQVIPEIVERVAHLDVYQRTPNWVLPRDSYLYPKWIKWLFAKAPWFARAYRGFYFTMLEGRFGAFKKQNNFFKQSILKTVGKHMKDQVRDPDLWAKLKPDYPVGCKRILISDNYFPAIQSDNLELITDPIVEITKTGIRTEDGKERNIDVLILATGFKPFDILESIDVVGPSDLSLGEAWKDGIKAHRTIAVPGFPNFFMLLGPNSGLGHNSVILMIEAQVNYIIKLIKQASATGARLVAPKSEAAANFDAKLQSDLNERVWAADCGAWYVDEHGRNYTLYPHSVRDYIREMKDPVFDEYAFQPVKERL